MHLAYHGGKCCGVKTIYDMGSSPSQVWPYLSAATKTDKDRYGHHVASSDRCFPLTAPEEPGSARLDRYLKWLRDNRPAGLVEIYLATASCSCCDQLKNGWPEALKERGFIEDEPFRNSNSGHWVTRFTLVMKKEEEKPKKKQKALRLDVAEEREAVPTTA